jgi:hypothetical protein
LLFRKIAKVFQFRPGNLLIAHFFAFSRYHEPAPT